MRPGRPDPDSCWLHDSWRTFPPVPYSLGSHYSGSVRLLSPLVSDFSIKSAATGPGPATGHLLPALQIRAAAYQHPAARGQHSHRGTINIIHKRRDRIIQIRQGKDRNQAHKLILAAGRQILLFFMPLFNFVGTFTPASSSQPLGTVPCYGNWNQYTNS